MCKCVCVCVCMCVCANCKLITAPYKLHWLFNLYLFDIAYYSCSSLKKLQRVLLSTVMWYNYMYSHEYIWWDLIIKWSWTFVLSKYQYHAHGIIFIIIVNLSTTSLYQLNTNEIIWTSPQYTKKHEAYTFMRKLKLNKQINNLPVTVGEAKERVQTNRHNHTRVRPYASSKRMTLINPTTAFIILHYHRYSMTLKEEKNLKIMLNVNLGREGGNKQWKHPNQSHLDLTEMDKMATELWKITEVHPQFEDVSQVFGIQVLSFTIFLFFCSILWDELVV